MDRFREGLNQNGISGPSSWRQNASGDFKSTCPSLSYETRLWGFLACIGAGVALSFFSSIFLWLSRFEPFAIYYSLGSISSLFSSFFLVGPCKQFSLMFAKSRWVATVIYLAAIGGTLAVVFVLDIEPKILQIAAVLSLVLIQFLAAFWYGLSFIPYGRTVITKLLAFTCCGRHDALD